jgi:hypothetical protein
MKHPFLRRFAASACLVLGLCAPVVSAQLKPAPSPVGDWSFQTGELRGGCDISGDMLIVETAKRTYSCTFKAVQTCKGRLPRAIHTEQSCIATQAGSEVTITSKVEKIVSVDPASMMPGMDQRYAADNFIVRINSRGDEMDGRFESIGTALVKFRRRQDLVS